MSEPAIDLHVEKVVTSTPDFTPAGYLFFLDPVTYRIEVTNNGIGDAANVQLTEILDAPLIVESITPSQGSCSATDCNLGTITPGQAPVTIDVQARAGTGFEDYPSAALLNNTATVSAPVGREINPDDNSASAVIPTVPWAETSITKAFAPAQPLAGGPVTYTLTVHSDGPGTVDMVVADVLPEALLKPPTSISISGGTGVCQYDPTGESLGVPPPGFPIVGCDIPQFGPGEDRVITIEGTLAPDSAGTEVTNLGLSSNTLPLAGAFSFEPDFSNNDDYGHLHPGVGRPAGRQGAGRRHGPRGRRRRRRVPRHRRQRGDGRGAGDDDLRHPSRRPRPRGRRAGLQRRRADHHLRAVPLRRADRHPGHRARARHAGGGRAHPHEHGDRDDDGAGREPREQRGVGRRHGRPLLDAQRHQDGRLGDGDRRGRPRPSPPPFATRGRAPRAA